MTEDGLHDIAKVIIEGRVVRDFEVISVYPNSWSAVFEKAEWPAGIRPSAGRLSVFRVARALIGPFCIPFDLDLGFAFSNHFYENGAALFPVGELVEGKSFRHEVRAGPSVAGPMVVLGGPVDGNYYHWLLSWCSRLSIVQHLAPELLENRDVRFLVDVRASQSPFIDHLHGLGVTEDRIVWSDPDEDQEVTQAILVTLPSQNAYHHEIITGLAKRLVSAIDPRDRRSSKRRIWISREELAAPKRRVTNFAAIEPVLRRFGIKAVVLESLSAQEQIALFSEAELVVGVHGAGLANLIFCPPDCRVLILEKSFNVAVGLARTFTILAEVCQLRHEMLLVDVDVQAGVDYDSLFNAHHQDVIVSPQALAAALQRLG